MVCHEPSPRRYVVALAVPLPKRAVEMVPVAILPASRLGMSAATSALNVGAPATPSGDANTRLAVWDANVNDSVPLPVTGDPVTLKIDGALSPTDVTVPPPPGVAHAPSPRRNVVAFAVPLPNRAVAIVPLVIFVASRLGMSAATRALNVGTPVTPSGAAKTTLAVCEVRVNVKVPLLVTGDPDTLKIDGALIPTDVTVPVGIVCHEPSPRRYVVVLAVPLPSLAVAIVPLVIFAASMLGISAATSALNVGVPETPSGAANTKLAV
jgi:hypothetical protein